MTRSEVVKIRVENCILEVGCGWLLVWQSEKIKLFELMRMECLSDGDGQEMRYAPYLNPKERTEDDRKVTPWHLGTLLRFEQMIAPEVKQRSMPQNSPLLPNRVSENKTPQERSEIGNR